jgi:hypothetical protein
VWRRAGWIMGEYNINEGVRERELIYFKFLIIYKYNEHNFIIINLTEKKFKKGIIALYMF